MQKLAYARWGDFQRALIVYLCQGTDHIRLPVRSDRFVKVSATPFTYDSPVSLADNADQASEEEIPIDQEIESFGVEDEDEESSDDNEDTDEDEEVATARRPCTRGLEFDNVDILQGWWPALAIGRAPERRVLCRRGFQTR